MDEIPSSPVAFNHYNTCANTAHTKPIVPKFGERPKPLLYLDGLAGTKNTNAILKERRYPGMCLTGGTRTRHVTASNKNGDGPSERIEYVLL